MSWIAVGETLRVAAGVTAISLAFGTWLGYWLRGRREASAVSVLLLLPPTIICCYFLIPTFTPEIAVAAGVVFGLPFVARAARIAFEKIERDTLNAARICGASEWRVFWRVAAPLSVRPVLSAAAALFVLMGGQYATIVWFAGHP